MLILAMVIRTMQLHDWNSVSEIYAEGLATGYATFESTVPPYSHWDKTHIKECRLVAENHKTVVGWAALSAVSNRPVYRGVAEVSIYISAKYRGQGVGKALMQQLTLASQKAGYWTLQSGIFPENEASIALHKKMGFRFVGKRELVGRTVDGIWKDNLLFERRSKRIGIH
ncbi:GCN5-related N-acetyltransferase [Croceitalea dokdonensis DOKDO 023]|uniref:GCN5-related N-acetyltransferase n=1 Tax=Croceitalea dokdonensis DOKDO 023 TaxID=1300341 RepID=A0A0P7AFX9_9FLAO|nr:GCN5-related N-acetyltransferase [Croceitalea dokdonensis DOKDO 023]